MINMGALVNTGICQLCSSCVSSLANISVVFMSFTSPHQLLSVSPLGGSVGAASRLGACVPGRHNSLDRMTLAPAALLTRSIARYYQTTLPRLLCPLMWSGECRDWPPAAVMHTHYTADHCSLSQIYVMEFTADKLCTVNSKYRAG